MVGQFRSSVWDPMLIIGQMVTMQCIFYVGLGVCIVIVDYIGALPRSIDQIFSYQALQAKGLQGRMIMIAFVINALTSALGLWYVVKRTKLCWDFSTTVDILHLLFCCLYNGAFPTAPSWWLVNVIAVIISTVLGEFLCLHTELKAIPLSGAAGPKTDL